MFSTYDGFDFSAPGNINTGNDYSSNITPYNTPENNTPDLEQNEYFEEESEFLRWFTLPEVQSIYDTVHPESSSVHKVKSTNTEPIGRQKTVSYTLSQSELLKTLIELLTTHSNVYCHLTMTSDGPVTGTTQTVISLDSGIVNNPPQRLDIPTISGTVTHYAIHNNELYVCFNNNVTRTYIPFSSPYEDLDNDYNPKIPQQGHTLHLVTGHLTAIFMVGNTHYILSSEIINKVTSYSILEEMYGNQKAVRKFGKWTKIV